MIRSLALTAVLVAVALGSCTLAPIENAAEMAVRIAADDGNNLSYRLAGRQVFVDHCAACHGMDGSGSVGIPDLTSPYSLWPQSLEDVVQTVRFGIRAEQASTRSSLMPGYLGDHSSHLQIEEILDLVEITLKVAGLEHDADAALRAEPTFRFACAECHGLVSGIDQQWYGAPLLQQGLWLYGSDRATVFDVIARGRAGVSPAFENVLSASEIATVALYVSSLRR